MTSLPHHLSISLPDWAHRLARRQVFGNDTDKMAFVIGLARQNVMEGTGGPFAAAVFDKDTGELLGMGVNQVVPANNSALHAEVMAIMLAEQAIGSYSLASGYELFSSCEPCAMCLGATLWSGVGRLVCAATGEDARAIGFDEGPVFPASWDYLAKRGVHIEHEVMREEARAVFDLYRLAGGTLYNGH